VQCTTQAVPKESHYMTANVNDMQQQQQQPKQDERLLCIRILNVDSDEVCTYSHSYATATNSTVCIVLT
jgi:hypothetical protein